MDEFSMAELTRLDEDFVDTLERASEDLINRSDEEIAYQIFEEFDVGAHSFLYSDNLERLYRAGFIDEEIKTMSLELRSRAIDVLANKRDVEQVRTDLKWRAVLTLSDKIRRLKSNFDEINKVNEN